MSPSALTLALFVLQEGIKLEPAIAADLQQMFSKGIPTEQDWLNLRLKVASKAYRDYVPDTCLPGSVTQ